MRQLALLLLLYYCSSCQKQRPKDDKYWGHAPLDSSVYGYLYQPQGSILLFQDSLSGAIDTVNIYETTLDTIEAFNDYNKLIFSCVSWTQKERHSGTGYEFWMDLVPRDPRYFTSNMIHKYGITNRFGNDIFLFTPFSGFLGSSVDLDHNSKNTITHFYDSISFDSTFYNNVYVVQTIGEASMNHTDNLYYYAKGYGLIRWEELTNQKVWKRLR